MTVDAPRHSSDFERLRSEWLTLTSAPDPIPDWTFALESMAGEVLDLRSKGMWRAGRKTLLGALGLHHDEVVMCRGLAWLLTPDAWHGLGSAVLDQLLTSLKLEIEGSAAAVVAVEEVLDNTRADIVVRFGSTTIVIEAKIWAGEQPTQCDRLAHHWADEMPRLVFLTRIGSEPVTAIASRGQWHSVAWSDIADMVETVIRDRDEVDVGVQEYLRTLRAYGGSRA